MTFTLNAMMLQPIVALIAGILILVTPRILNFIVAIYLIFLGVTGGYGLILYRPFRTEGATGSHGMPHLATAAGKPGAISS